jgi:hypothetical protein
MRFETRERANQQQQQQTLQTALDVETISAGALKRFSNFATKKLVEIPLSTTSISLESWVASNSGAYTIEPVKNTFCVNKNSIIAF